MLPAALPVDNITGLLGPAVTAVTVVVSEAMPTAGAPAASTLLLLLLPDAAPAGSGTHCEWQQTGRTRLG